MRGPSSRCLPNRVDLYPVTVTIDPSGAGLPSAYPNSPSVSAIPCSVQVSNIQRMADGSMVVNQFYTGWIEFASDLGIKLDDRLVWAGPVRTLTLYVNGVSDGAGRGGVFGAQVEERV